MADQKAGATKFAIQTSRRRSDQAFQQIVDVVGMEVQIDASTAIYLAFTLKVADAATE